MTLETASDLQLCIFLSDVLVGNYRAHNPEVAGSNPAPATKEPQVRAVINDHGPVSVSAKSGNRADIDVFRDHPKAVAPA
jgi:hypothetical protein